MQRKVFRPGENNLAEPHVSLSDRAAPSNEILQDPLNSDRELSWGHIANLPCSFLPPGVNKYCRKETQ